MCHRDRRETVSPRDVETKVRHTRDANCVRMSRKTREFTASLHRPRPPRPQHSHAPDHAHTHREESDHDLRSRLLSSQAAPHRSHHRCRPSPPPPQTPTNPLASAHRATPPRGAPRPALMPMHAAPAQLRLARTPRHGCASRRCRRHSRLAQARAGASMRAESAASAAYAASASARARTRSAAPST
jgi:hypothetical protein